MQNSNLKNPPDQMIEYNFCYFWYVGTKWDPRNRMPLIFRHTRFKTLTMLVETLDIAVLRLS